MRLPALWLALAMGLATTGCFIGGGKPKVRIPPVPVPAAPSPAAPQAIPPQQPKAAIPEPPTAQRPPTPAKPTPPRTRPVTRPAIATPPAEVVTPHVVAAPPTPVPQTPPPQLGAMLTTSQARQAEADFQASLQRARTAFNRANGKQLTKAQRDTLERIRVFMEQALAEKQRDIATALQLVRRADLLGQDLLKGLPQ